MAATVKVEIPIEATDKTARGVNSAKKNFTALEKSIEKTERQLERLGKTHCNVDVDVDDNATSKIYNVESAVEKVGGLSADVEVGADDNASSVINAVTDNVSRLDGSSADAELGADDNATPVVSAASDAVEMFDGMSGDAEIGADDNATQIVDAAKDKVENFSGMSGDATIGAEDNASPVIDAAKDKGESFDGSVWTATVSIVDAATAPLQEIINAAKNPITQAGATLGVSIGVIDSVDTFKDFEAIMSQVKAISGATGSEFETLNQKAKQMGADTKFSAYESAEAFNYMAMAGWKTKDMIGGIEGIMSLSAASGESLGTTSDIVTDALTAFGLKAGDASHFSDVLAQASSNANTNVGMLGESFKYVAPVAGALNYSIEDTSLALGLMANSSIKGSMAGTALKTSLANMAKPTSNMAKAMNQYGISLTDSEGNMKTLKGVMDNLRDSMGGLSETEQTAAATAIFGKEAMAGMLAIINASEEDYAKLTDAVYNADGAAKQMADTMMDNLGGSLELLGGAVDEVKMSLGERLSPYLRGTADALAEQMPGLKEKINSVMDGVDQRAMQLKQNIGAMVASDEWQDADLFGKINIAWDQIVAEPFMQWAGGSGKSLISNGLSTLFSEGAKILPGGEKAGVMSWISTGLIAKGMVGIAKGASGVLKTLQPISGVIRSIGLAAQTAPSIGAFVTDLGSMIPMAGKFGIAALGITAAITGIVAAVDKYNEDRATADLAEHFGSIALSAEQVQSVAKGIINARYLTNVEVAMNEFKGADKLRADAERALESNQALTWKSSIGIELTAEEQADYTANIETFVESKISELESRTFAAHISVQTFLGGTKEGDTLASRIEEWARADHLELTNLSNDLKTAVENALEDGIIDVDEASAVAALQEKMNNITNQWKKAESQAQLDWINQEYGSLSGKDLNAESFSAVVDAMGSYRESAASEAKGLATEMYTFLNAAESAGRITSAENDGYKEMVGQAIRNQKAESLMTSLGFETNTMRDSYGDAISENQKKSTGSMDKQMPVLDQYAREGDAGSLIDAISSGYSSVLQGGGWDALQSATQNNLDSLWSTLKPDADAMAAVVDEYVNAGQAVPRQIMDQYVDAMEVGAASGDMDAAMQVYADNIAQSGNDALVQAVGELASNGSLGPEFAEAWKRMTAEVTDEPVTIEGLKAEIDGEAIDLDKDKWVSSLNEKLGDLGEVSDVTAEDITIKVKSGDCLWEIGEALGLDWQTIADQNGIESPYTIHPDQELVISRDGISVDSSSVGDAIDSAMSALTAEGAEFTVSADGVTVDLANVQVDSETAMAQIEAALGMESGALSGAGIDIQTGGTVTIPQELVNVDTSGMAAAVEAAAQTEPVETETSATVTATNAITDASGARASSDAQIDEAFAAPHETNSDVDVTLSQTNNTDAIYGEVDGEIQGKFAAGYSTTAPVNVTLDWRIVNPTANISVGGAGTGSASVSASIHANGGEVGLNGPELSWVGEEGLEYIIPTVPGRRGRGIALWRQAGQALGVLDNNGQIAGHANGGIVGPGGEISPKGDIFPIFSKDGGQEIPVWTVTGAEPNEDDGNQKEGNYQVNASPAVQQASGNNIEVKVEMNPVIKIDGGSMDEQKVFDVIKDRCRELADDLGGEIAERMTKIFENMPIVQGA